MKTLITLAVLAVCQIGFAQKTIELKSFKNFAASGNIEISLVKSSENKLVIERGNPEELKVTSEDGVLALSTDKAKDKIKAVVHYNAAIETIAAAAGVKITGRDAITTASCSISAASGCEITLNVAVDDLNTAAASGAELNLSGSAKKHNIAVASGAELKAEKLIAADTVVSVASGGEASIHSTGTVNATVASSAELNIYGNPKDINELKASGGVINIMR